MKRMALVLFIIMSVLIMSSSPVNAHELYIDVNEYEQLDELHIDIVWGHIRNNISVANSKDYELFVRYPNGETEQLDLEDAGVISKAYVTIGEEGDYTFWALRNPGTHSPQEGVTELSHQMAKTIYHVGDGVLSGNESVDLDLEIIPDISISDITTGTFTGTVYFEGNPFSGARVTAYGPELEVLEGTSDDEGKFIFDLNSEGKWLVKANVKTDEEGMYEGEEYNQASMTTTLLINSHLANEESIANNWTLVAVGVIGLLIGASVTLFVLHKRL